MGVAKSKQGKQGTKKGTAKGTGTGKDPQISEWLEQTHFSEVEVQNLFKTFMDLSPTGQVDRETFNLCLERLEQYGLRNPNDTPFADRLFELLDVNGDGVVDINEFICGLSMLCKGTPEEKLALSFKAYDLDGNGFISEKELTAMFKSAWLAGFKALAFNHGGEDLDFDQLDEFSSSMAQNFARNAFETLDTDGDGQLSLEEFTQFALAQPKITATLNGFKHEVSIVLN